MNYGYNNYYGGQYYQPAPPPPPVKKKSKKWLPFAIIGAYKLIVIVLMITVIATVSSLSYTAGSGQVPTLFGKAYFSIQTDSMYPTFSHGDLIIGDPDFEVEELKVGDIITYWTVISGERVLNTHRIYEIYDGGDYLIFATKGDNNNVVDSLTVHESEIVSVYERTIGGAGRTLDYLQTPSGFGTMVVVGILLIVF